MTNADYVILSPPLAVENICLNTDQFLGVITVVIIIIDICLLVMG